MLASQDNDTLTQTKSSVPKAERQNTGDGFDSTEDLEKAVKDLEAMKAEDQESLKKIDSFQAIE
ncbi:MAG TPA: hypothetical protein VF572_06485 [Candidatus Saccharimonadales bacterium]